MNPEKFFLQNGSSPERNSSIYEVDSWRETDLEGICQLELVWREMLQKRPEHIATILRNYGDQQIVLRRNNIPVAAMSAILLEWDGTRSSLPNSWDAIAGGSESESDFTKTSVERNRANTYCLMSSAVDPSLKIDTPNGRTGLGDTMLEAAEQRARDLGMKRILAPARPMRLGEDLLAQVQNGQLTSATETHLQIFERYCQKEENGKIYDPWLRVLFRHGFQPLQVSYPSMTVKIPIEDFVRIYKDEPLAILPDGKIQGNDTGHWFLDKDFATYKEANLMVFKEIA